MLCCEGLLEIEVTAFVLKQPIQQHCLLKSVLYDSIKCLILPPQPEYGKVYRPLDVVWVPSQPGSGASLRLSHIVPARCKKLGPLGCWIDKCGLQAVCRCLHVNDESSMVQCDACNQWFHIDCIREKEENVSGSVPWFCGCEVLANQQLICVR